VIQNEVGSAKISDPAEADPRSRMSRISPRRGSLPTIIRSFKAAVTRLCHRTGHPEFGWQECYHDRIIRNERELANIRQYILDNPANWEDS
jgi:hypothetical protein